MTAEERDDLILDYLEGSLSGDKLVAVEKILSTDPEAGRRIAELSLQECALREIAETEQLSRSRRSPRPRRYAGLGPSGGWIWAAAAVFAVAILGAVLTGEKAGPRKADVSFVPPPMPAPAPQPRDEKPPLPPLPEPPQPIPVPLPPPTPRTPEPVTPAATPPPLPAPPTVPVSPAPRRGTFVAVARLDRLEGAVRIVGEDAPAKARAGELLNAGWGLETDAANSWATLRYEDGTLLHIGPGTSVAKFTQERGKRVELSKGAISAQVLPQPSDQPMIIATPQADARVLGTRLTVSTDGIGTRVEVTEGRVQAIRQSDRASVEVSADHYAVVKPGTPLLSRALPPLFQDSFDASPLGEWPRGWRRHATEAATRSAFVVMSDPGRPRDRFVGYPSLATGLTQHAVVPIDDWGVSFVMTYRLRLTGMRNDRAGVEFSDARLDPSFEVDANSGVFRVDWPRGKVLKQVPLKPALGTWSEWKISFDGPQVRVEMDRKPLLEIVLSEFGRVREVSLVSKGADDAQFDDVKVIRR